MIVIVIVPTPPPTIISAQSSIFGELFPGLNNNILEAQVCGLIDKIQPLMNGNFNVNIYLVNARTLKVKNVTRK